MLKDKFYIDEVKKVILDVKKQYACTTDPDNVCNVPNEELKLTITDQLFFEMLLLEIRGKTISYASFKKKMEREKEEMLLIEINTLQKNITDDNVKLLEDKLNQLQEIRAIKIQGMAVRSKVRWMTEGEKTSKYFCSLENRHFFL